MLQVLTIVVVYLLFIGAATGSSGESEDGAAGFAFLIIGLAAAPAVAMIVGAIFAWRLRLRVFGLYALAPAAAFAAMFALRGGNIFGLLTVGFVVGVLWNLLTAAVAGKKA